LVGVIIVEHIHHVPQLKSCFKKVYADCQVNYSSFI
jgi:hypothetical protein